jgi:hypothetical protein
MIPDHLLPHTVTVVHPLVTTDSYNDQKYDYGAAATRVDITGWIQQDTRAAVAENGGDPLTGGWLLMTNSTEPSGRDRIEWDGRVFSTAGEPAPVCTPAGLHHLEVPMEVVDG